MSEATPEMTPEYAEFGQPTGAGPASGPTASEVIACSSCGDAFRPDPLDPAHDEGPCTCGGRYTAYIPRVECDKRVADAVRDGRPHDLVCNANHNAAFGVPGCSCVGRIEREARHDQMEADCKAVCRGCREDAPVVVGKRGRLRHLVGPAQIPQDKCQAAAIYFPQGGNRGSQ